MFCEMNPRHIDSLKISSLGTLDMGTVVTCVKIKADATPPTNSLVSWPDGASMFHLLPQHDFATGTMDEQSSSLQNEPEYHLIYEAGSSNAVWIVGNEVVCKVHEVVYGWVDKAIHRSFLVMKRIRARTLEVAWPQLTQQQRLNIAKEVADHTTTVASNTCDHLQTISGCGIRIPSLMQGYDFDGPIPNWFPRTIGPFSGPELRAHWSKISSVSPPSLDDTFVLYHDDHGPTNVLISDDGDKVAAIID